MSGCDRCDECGGEKTYANQACLPISGKVRCIDWCIHQLVAALNAGGVYTTACCCGHGTQDGRIDLEDGRILMITAAPDTETSDNESNLIKVLEAIESETQPTKIR